MKVKSIIFILLLSTFQFFAQTGKFAKSNIDIAKTDAELIIPVDIILGKLKTATPCTISITAEKSVQTNSLSEAELKLITSYVVVSSFTVKEKIEAKAFVTVGKTVPNAKTFNLKLTILTSGPQEDYIIPVNLLVPTDFPYSISDYFNDDLNLKIETITKIESSSNTLTLTGIKDDQIIKRRVVLDKDDIFYLRNFYPIWRRKTFAECISIITVPIKVRPALNRDIAGRDTFLFIKATADLKNLGLNFDIYKMKTDRYFASGKKSTHQLSVGLFGAPSVEELDYTTTNGKILSKTAKNSQLFASTGLTINYSYNDIYFVFVPYGCDFAVSPLGQHWIYNGKRWWGFGIGISPKIFSINTTK